MWADTLQEAAAFIRVRDDFLVVSHVQPEGDALGSTVAIGWLLEKLGKTYTMLNEGPVPSRLRYLWRSGDIVTILSDEPPQRQYRNVICVDCADYGRVGYRGKDWVAEGADL